MDINLIGFGPNTGIETQVDPTHYASRVASRPIDHQPAVGGVNGGHYAIASMTGLMAAGIASAVRRGVRLEIVKSAGGPLPGPTDR